MFFFRINVYLTKRKTEALKKTNFVLREKVTFEKILDEIFELREKVGNSK